MRKFWVSIPQSLHRKKNVSTPKFNTDISTQKRDTYIAFYVIYNKQQ